MRNHFPTHVYTCICSVHGKPFRVISEEAVGNPREILVAILGHKYHESFRQDNIWRVKPELATLSLQSLTKGESSV